MAIDKDLLNEGETIVVSTRTHPKALLLPIFALVVLLAIGVVRPAARSTEELVDPGGLDRRRGRRRLVRPAAVPDLAHRDLRDHQPSADHPHGVITRRGHDIPLTRISDVAYEKDLIDRLLGCGTLVISDASTHGQVALPDIPRIEKVQRELSDLLHELHTEDARDEGV